MRLAGETPCDLRTALRYLRGEHIRSELLRYRIAVAAERLGLAPAQPSGAAR